MIGHSVKRLFQLEDGPDLRSPPPPPSYLRVEPLPACDRRKERNPRPIRLLECVLIPAHPLAKVIRISGAAAMLWEDKKPKFMPKPILGIPRLIEDHSDAADQLDGVRLICRVIDHAVDAAAPPGAEFDVVPNALLVMRPAKAIVLFEPFEEFVQRVFVSFGRDPDAGGRIFRSRDHGSAATDCGGGQ